ncbi:coproporphyrinogen III oxidase, anaerobic [Pasteurella testudinis DSM 23072]|uniref:Coproporphyrinogen III oxidase, anaerobic n=1 Tax=Pasteurella testudinis DSM 23072 TaxID=1122938 RepID=A0A1W1UKE2_9PAST|nr:heme anaerobic degradation radical SAM methyltransferase ChuW/HutW [Pasteurella testudinis]SMB81214.1 coproporphyrinogen III oxidase, anaerobic [Pasteurella testudinis DSM 23072]SUB51967.1 oxygen-independent coproporphyrinogen-III oxidase [Pasteurella testudinis]
MPFDISSFFAQQGELPFPSRQASMPWGDSVPVQPDLIQTQWAALQNEQPQKNKRVLYLHIPFCETHCTFCGFYQNRYAAGAAQQYTDFLCREIEQESDSVFAQSAPIQAVYFGGGTPTALSAAQLVKILTLLKQRFPLAADCEITIETRVAESNKEKLAACFEAGANRISIGLQTFDTQIRRGLGRKSTEAQIIDFIAYLIALDQGAIVCDLLFGLPNQTQQTLLHDLALIDDLQMDGVDLYALNILPKTILGKAVANNKIQVADFVERAAMYQCGSDWLAEYHWQQISNSHWAKTTRERNLYNLWIKDNATCLAFGCGAGGNSGNWNFMQQRQLDEYYKQVELGQKPIAMLFRRPPYATRNAKLQGAIEKGVLRCEQHFDQTELAILSPLFEQWQSCGLCEYSNEFSEINRLVLTTKGRFWASQLLGALQTFIKSRS